MFRPIAAQVTLILLTACSGFANAETATFLIPTERFGPYEPNYAIMQATDNDSDALEAQFSFRYMFSNPNATENNVVARTEWYFKFTGEFDFYWGSRFSSPVINRRSNPALHVRKYFVPGKFLGGSWHYLDVGIQHLSNGQVQDPFLSRAGTPRPQVVYEQDPHDPFFDRISRSINYLSIETLIDFDGSGPASERKCSGWTSCIRLGARLIPYHFDNDNPVTWGPEDKRTSRITDYDRLRLALAKKINFGNGNGFNEAEFGVEWTVGDALFETDSFDYYVAVPYEINDSWRLPFYVRYHYGPLNNFSNYTKKQNSIGIGFRLY